MTSAISIIGGFAILATICWQLALILLAVIPFFVLFTVRWNNRMDDASAVVEGERICEMGTRLTAQNGAFVRLWQAQNLDMDK